MSILGPRHEEDEMNLYLGFGVVEDLSCESNITYSRFEVDGMLKT